MSSGLIEMEGILVEADFEEQDVPELKKLGRRFGMLRRLAWASVALLALAALLLYALPGGLHLFAPAEIAPPSGAKATDGISWWPFAWIVASALCLWAAQWALGRFLIRKATREPLQPVPFYVDAKMPGLFASLGLARSVKDFRKHEIEPSPDLDVEATVEKTCRLCGIFTPVFDVRRKAPEYLVLIDQESVDDHHALWVGALAQRLKDHGVYVKRFYFDGDPRLCHPVEDMGKTLALEALAEKYPEHRLIIFAKGAGFLHQYEDGPPEWTRKLFAWKKRALMLLDAANPDTFRFHPFKEMDFVVMPATEEGLASMIEHMGEYPVADRQLQGVGQPMPPFIPDNDFEWLNYLPPEPERMEKLFQALKEYFPDAPNGPAWKWFCACAVYPELKWHLTLFLGYRLKDQDGSAPFTLERFLQKIRLPWISGGGKAGLKGNGSNFRTLKKPPPCSTRNASFIWPASPGSEEAICPTGSGRNCWKKSTIPSASRCASS